MPGKSPVVRRTIEPCRTFDPRHIAQADITDEVYAIPRGYRTT